MFEAHGFPADLWVKQHSGEQEATVTFAMWCLSYSGDNAAATKLAS